MTFLHPSFDTESKYPMGGGRCTDGCAVLMLPDVWRCAMKTKVLTTVKYLALGMLFDVILFVAIYAACIGSRGN